MFTECLSVSIARHMLHINWKTICVCLLNERDDVVFGYAEWRNFCCTLYSESFASIHLINLFSRTHGF